MTTPRLAYSFPENFGSTVFESGVMYSQRQVWVIVSHIMKQSVETRLLVRQAGIGSFALENIRLTEEDESDKTHCESCYDLA